MVFVGACLLLLFIIAKTLVHLREVSDDQFIRRVVLEVLVNPLLTNYLSLLVSGCVCEKGERERGEGK